MLNMILLCRFGIVYLFLVFVWIERVRALNYGRFFSNFARAPVLPQGTVSEPIGRNDATLKSREPQTKQVRRKLGVPYTIFYQWNFPQNRGGKNLNLTLHQDDSQVQSRIMNNPQPYPTFAIGINMPEYEKAVKEVHQAPPPTSSDEYDDSKSPGFPPVSNTYRLKDSQYILPPPGRYNKGVDPYIYMPPQRYNKTTDFTSHFPEPKVDQPFKVNPAIPSLGYNKDTKVPKAKIPPLQIYNKATFVGPASPPDTNKVQQYISCICVQYYLCKNGVINSGGKLQATQRRERRSPNYNYGNKTFLAYSTSSKIVNNYDNKRIPKQDICEQDKVCCEVNLDDEDDGNYYPVATPPPEPSYVPPPPRFPSKPKEDSACGIRAAYGVQSRLKQLQYSRDVSEFGEYPWQAAVLKKVEGGKNLYLCGGVLIAPQWVATVAHCVKKDKSSPLLIRLGEWDVNRKDELYPYSEKDVTVIVLHPEFNPESLENDLALIKLQNPVDPRILHITPACLPNPAQVYEGQKCWVSGWGKDFFGPQGEYQNVLKEVDVPVISRALCNTELRSTNLGPNFVLHPGFLCAGGEAGKDACTGDGGSPLVCKSNGLFYVVGLVSWGIGCGQPGVPGVYVNVLYYTDWIKSITKR